MGFEFRFLQRTCGDSVMEEPRQQLEKVVGMAAYTVSMDLAEHFAPGYHLSAVQQLMEAVKPQIDSNDGISGYGKYSPGFDDLRKFGMVVEVLGELSVALDLQRHCIAELVCALIADRRLPNARLHLPDLTLEYDSCEWLACSWAPLLLLPLVDVATLTLAMSTTHAAMRGGEGLKMTNTAALIHGLPWIAFARLVQLCILRSEGIAMTSTATVRDLTQGPLAPLVHCLISSGALLPTTSCERWREVLIEWLAFLRVVAHLALRMPKGNWLKNHFLEMVSSMPRECEALVLPLSAATVTDEAVVTHIQMVNMSFLLESDPLEWSEVGDVVARWCSDRRGHLQRMMLPEFDVSQQRRYIVYPPMRRQQLIDLPCDYTKLHAKVMALCPFEFPAVCLVCGAIVNAAGQGQCYMHSMKCGEGAGIFFLIQVSIMYCYLPLSWGVR